MFEIGKIIFTHTIIIRIKKKNMFYQYLSFVSVRPVSSVNRNVEQWGKWSFFVPKLYSEKPLINVFMIGMTLA